MKHEELAAARPEWVTPGPGTHAEGCWKYHFPCAIARLRAEVARLTCENLRLARIIDPAYGLADPIPTTRTSTEGEAHGLDNDDR